jgi:hypothetical protein
MSLLRLASAGLTPILAFAAICLSLGSAQAAPAPLAPAVAFFYAERPPLDELRAFDWVVLDPDHVQSPLALPAPTRWHAYVSVGELDPRRPYAPRVPAAWLREANTAWGTRRIDHAAPGWVEFFVRDVVGPLWARGWRAFFLDTLDAHRAIARDAAALRAQEEALARMIERLHAEFPGIALIANRGFEWLPRVRGRIAAVAVESLYRGWHAGERRYVEVPAADRGWLAERLRATATTLGVPAIAIDYVPPGERALARATAARIRADGFVPWVADGALGTLGVGDLEVQPRRVLLVTDLAPGMDFMHSAAYRYLALPLHWLGYIVEPVDVRGPLPQGTQRGAHAAVVTWFSQAPQALNPQLEPWLQQQLAAGLKLVMFNVAAVAPDAPLAATLGLQAGAAVRAPLPLAAGDARLGFETPPPARATPPVPLRLRAARQRWAQLVDGDERLDMVAVTDWGGIALAPYAVRELPGDGGTRWVIDPIAFLFEALGRPDFPVPDVTTEAGRRLLMVHIDGDGFPSRAERPGAPFAGEVLEREVLARYRVPHTVSVIQGEIAGNGLFAQLAPALEDIARRIFALPHVELASHSYSHPFRWRALADANPSRPGYVEGLNLVLPGYRFDLAAEIDGSARYIDDRLAPTGKRTQVFLWTGDCEPPAQAVQRAEAAGLLNMNGGDTLLTRDRPTLTLASGLGILRGEVLQVFAPNQNENLYTNNWRGPYWGYQRVIETFELTESPRRIKPVNIYYHVYSATKEASLAALHRVYGWALAQPLAPVYASDYIRKVRDFHRLALARDWRRAQPTWRVRGAAELRTLRLPPTTPVDFAASVAVAGAAAGPSARYLHLGGENAEVVLAAGPARPFVREASGLLDAFERHPRGLRFALRSYGHAEFTLAGAGACTVRVDGRVQKPTPAASGDTRYVLELRDPPGTARRFPVDVACEP